MPQTTPKIVGKLILTAFFWGGTWIAGRVAVQEASPYAVASWRFLLAAVVLGSLLVAREGWSRWTPRQWLALTALGLSGVFAYNVLFLFGLQRVEAGRGALVVAFIPVLVALADWLFFHLPMSPPKAFGIVLALGGCLLVVTHGEPLRLFAGEVGLGEYLLLGSALSWVVYTMTSRHYGKRFSPLAMTFGGCLTGWAMLTLAALIDGSLFAFGTLTWRGYASVAFLGLFGTAMAFTWYAQAITRIGVTKAAAFINLVPVFAVVLGVLLLDEPADPAVLGGGAMVIVGVLLTNRAAARS
ncbi:MAG: DMT family transporter [Propionivibrio sp.]